MSMLGVSQSAEVLGVSERRVRQMLVDGVLAGERVGRAWVIDRQQLREIEHRRPEVGRPWSAASAWAVLALADGGEPDLSPVERSRAKERLAQGLANLSNRLSARAKSRWFYAHPSVLERLADSPQLVRAGISALAEYGSDVLVLDGFEGYLRSRDLNGFVGQFALDERAARPNVLLRIVDNGVWPFLDDQGSAGRAVVAIDLLDSEDPRSRRAGAELLNAL